MVCCEINDLFTAKAPRTRSRYFFHLPVRGRQMKNNQPTAEKILAIINLPSKVSNSFGYRTSYEICP
jgi:hypothetical protein